MKAKISAVRDGFRRAGREWQTTPTPVDLDEFTPEQLAQLHADPAITIADARGKPIPAPGQKARGRIRADALAAFTDEQLDELEAITRDADPTQIDEAIAKLKTPDADAAAAKDAGVRGRLISLAVRALPARTKDGKASVADVRDATGLDDVSAAERDAAHDELEAEREKAAQAEREKAGTQEGETGEGAPQGD